MSSLETWINAVLAEDATNLSLDSVRRLQMIRQEIDRLQKENAELHKKNLRYEENVKPVEGETIARKEDTLYTYYQLDLENMPEDWDYTICESLDHVRETLQYLDVHLDDDTPTTNEEPRRVVITGVPMTPAAYRDFIKENNVP